MDLRPTWPTAASTLVFEEVGARMAFVEALRLFPELTIAGMPVSPTGHDGYEVDDNIVRQRKRWYPGYTRVRDTVKRMLLMILCTGVLSVMSGCYVAPYPYPYPSYGGYVGTDVSVAVRRGWGGHHHHGEYRGFRYGGYSGWHRGGFARWHR